jgi:hypothetical protein
VPSRTRVRATEEALRGTAQPSVEDDRDGRLALLTERLTAIELGRLCDPDNPAPFVEFAPSILGVTLTSAQAAIASVLYDGQAPPPEYAEQLFGGLTTAPTPEQRTTAVSVCGRGAGKALALDTPIPTPNGWTTMGELRVGSVVFDENGQPCRVTFVTEVMHERPCFEVVMDDGTVIVADADHQWFTWTKAARKSAGRTKKPKNPVHRPGVVTTTQIRETLRANQGREVNHSIPVCKPVEGAHAELPIDPYAFGVWLGDGTSDSSVVTSGDAEQFELLQAVGYEVSPRVVLRGRTPQMRVTIPGTRWKHNSFHSRLRKLGVFENKHIPVEYMRASVEQREALLAGLVDTDGHCSPRGHVEFSNTNPRLADGFLELALSLGFKATMQEGRAKIYGRDCGPKWRIIFTPHRPVFRLARKLGRQRFDSAQKRRAESRYVVDVRPCASVPVRCIQVDSPHSLYLASRAFVPTHNTSVLVAGRALHLALTVPLKKLGKREAALVAVVAPDQRQSRHTLAFVKGYVESRPALAALLEYESTLDVIRLTRPDGQKVTIEARPATSGGKAVRGPSLAGVLLDEAAFFYGDGYEVSDLEIYRAARPRLETGGQIVIASTPWAQTGLLWDLFREGWGKPGRATVAKAPTLVMRPSPEAAEMVRLEREADPDNAAREFDAEFLSADAERFFPEPLLERCVDTSLTVEDDGSVSRTLPDRTVIAEVRPGERVRPGADFGFDSDASALVVFVERASPETQPTHPSKPTIFDVCEIAEDRPSPGSHLIPSEIVSKYAAQVRRVGGKLVVADAHYRRSIEEVLVEHELALVPPPSQETSENYLVVRALMAAGRVRLPKHARLLQQLRVIRSTHRPGGHVSINLPRGKAAGGGHCDIVAALVCALSGVSITSKQPAPTPQSALEREVAAENRAKEERLRAVDKHEKQKDRQFSRLLRYRRVPASVLRQLRGG